MTALFQMMSAWPFSVKATDVRVFKTNVSGNTEPVSGALNLLLGFNQWNFDLEDRDAILRVTNQYIATASVVQLLKEHGFSCEELA